MYISQFRIKNYRGIKLETFYFSTFNTLIGKNDCGKSTVINALKFFFDESKATQKDFNYYVDTQKDIEIEIVLSEYNHENLKTFLVGGDKEDGFDEVVIDYLREGKLVVKKIWEYKEDSEVSAKTYVQVFNFIEHPIYTAKSTDITKWLKMLNITIPISGIGKNSDLEKLYFLRSELLKISEERCESWQEIKWFEIRTCLPSVEFFRADQSIETTTSEFKNTFSIEVRSIIKAEKESGASSTLKGIEEKISQKITEESEEIQKCMSEHISDLKGLRITPSFSWDKGVEITNVEIQLQGDMKFIPLENKGSGYRRLFMVGRLRYLADKKQSEDVIYLVEEPETFLHPSAQDEMKESLLSLSESNQIFITTHSPIFAGSTKTNGLTLCKKEGSTLIYEQRADDDFLFDIAKQLGVKPTHNILDTYESIIFVESPYDREFLRIASCKLGKKLHTSEQSNRVVILDGGGSSLNNLIDIRFFEQQGKKMYLIIDSDKFDEDQITDIKKRESLEKKQKENKELHDKFEAKNNSKCFILNKKNIESYYHPRAIEREIEVSIDKYPGIFPDNLCVSTFLQELKESNKKTIPKKNWISIYKQMTEDEWCVVSNNELELIFDTIDTV